MFFYYIDKFFLSLPWRAHIYVQNTLYFWKMELVHLIDGLIEFIQFPFIDSVKKTAGIVPTLQLIEWPW